MREAPCLALSARMPGEPSEAGIDPQKVYARKGGYQVDFQSLVSDLRLNCPAILRPSLYNGYGRLNKRKHNKALTHHDIKAIAYLWQWARLNKLALNVRIDVRPRNVDDMTVQERIARFQRILKNYAAFARRRRFTPAYLHTRESLVGDVSEHLHIACHVPARYCASFIRCVFNWCEGPDEISARPCTNRTTWLKTGKCKSALGYMIKNMTPQAAYGRPYIRTKGGGLWGKRWGCSHNLKVALAKHVRASMGG